MIKNNKILKNTLLSSLIALSAISLNTNASVLLQGWDNSGDAGFGDLALNRNDDGSSSAIAFDSFELLNFDSGLNFFNNSYDQFFINNNGNVTFNSPVSAFTPESFPVSSQPMLAPFWGDVDTRCTDCGEVYIGSPNADTLVITWDSVGFFSSDSSLTNTFQLVLIDRADTGAGNFDVEFRYEDINWTTGNASGGSNGLGGTPAQAGYDAGDGVNFFVVPGSQTSTVVDLDTAPSNTDTAGIWTFAVRDGELPGDTAENPILPTIDPANPGDYSFEFAITDEDPIFIDPEVAIGYDYIINSGPLFTSVLLPETIGDGLFDLWLWDLAINDWFDTGTVLTGGVWYDFGQATDRFRILGIETTDMLDPTNPTAFVTGLRFDGRGIVNLNQTALTTFVADPSTSVPGPQTLIIFILGLGFIARKYFSTNK